MSRSGLRQRTVCCSCGTRCVVVPWCFYVRARLRRTSVLLWTNATRCPVCRRAEIDVQRPGRAAARVWSPAELEAWACGHRPGPDRVKSEGPGRHLTYPAAAGPESRTAGSTSR